MTTKTWLQRITFGLLACLAAAACTAASEDSGDDAESTDSESIGSVRSAQIKKGSNPAEGGGCTATSDIPGHYTSVSNGTYSSNGSGGFNCCSSAGPNQVCINCATSTSTCEDKARTTRPPVVGPVPTVVAP